MFTLSVSPLRPPAAVTATRSRTRIRAQCAESVQIYVKYPNKQNLWRLIFKRLDRRGAHTTNVGTQTSQHSCVCDLRSNRYKILIIRHLYTSSTCMPPYSAPPCPSSATSTKCRIFSLRPPREVTAPTAGTFLDIEPQDTPIPHPYKVRSLTTSAAKTRRHAIARPAIPRPGDYEQPPQAAHSRMISLIFTPSDPCRDFPLSREVRIAGSVLPGIRLSRRQRRNSRPTTQRRSESPTDTRPRDFCQPLICPRGTY